MSLVRVVFVAALALGIAACGWQLRGAGGGGFEGVPVAIEGDVGNRFRDRLAERLRDLDAVVVNDAIDARAVINIMAVSSRRRTVATDADGLASEYELRYRIRFSLEAGGKAGPEQATLARQTVRSSASFAANDDLQGRDAEEESLRRDLQDDALQLLLSRIGRRL
ncbi:LPS assembly lipoprotein LptE [Spiribacter vilamensis]|uniref:LPS-assembly lipoprotein LptE n=1 Tax=Spiribacter vilamensis TaxID=531306 RepID=A0A4Q8CY58_9GAMM|nr:LPS assembly lipoprotein LptE [Spiribacter vilamensis]RZU97820.1 LPS-assembly lipoprotein [Spiribacter vilamensis]TVO61256.1 hypothetical protein FPL09_03685 [Spiribacter vilamensis]